MAWKEIEKYAQQWNVTYQKDHKGKITLFFKDGSQFPCPDLSHEDFSVMVDMLRDEKSKWWFEDEHKILATGDKQPELIEKKTAEQINWDNIRGEQVVPGYLMSDQSEEYEDPKNNQ